ncbi:hypothetical protein MOUN0_J04830 [Monosporozyma unispora]
MTIKSPSYMSTTQSNMSGSYISNNLDQKLNENKYSYLIDAAKIQLTNNPLDDYQRTIFLSREHTSSINPNRTNLNELSSLLLKVKQTTYKSRLVQKIRDIPIIGQLVPENISVSNITGQLSNNVGGDKPNNVLNCFEYALPNIEISKDHSHENSNNVNNQTFQNGTMSLNQINNNNLADNLVNSQYLTTTNSKVPPTTDKILKGTVVVDNPILEDNKIIAKKYSAGNGPDSIVYSITKNQVFKNRKLKYLDSGKKMLFNPNNVILWSENMGFVYMTGIWRLYQEVMNGLSSMERENCTDNDVISHFCKDEYDTVVRNIFGKASDAHNIPRTNSRNKKSSNSGNNSTSENDFDVTKDTKDNMENVKQFDFKWEKVNPLIRKEVLEYYKCYLMSEKDISPELLQQIEQFNFVQKVRGGFIHIQGTWFPTELARPLCIMFAYPIRYLLTPLFGASFPKECEDWYRLYEKNGKQFKVFAAVFRYTNPLGYSQYNPSSNFFHPFNNMPTNRFVYPSEGNFFANSKDMQQPYLYSNTPDINAVNQPVVFQQQPHQHQDGSPMYNGFQIPNVQSSSSSSNYNNLTGKKTSERENPYDANNEKIINLPPINHLLNTNGATQTSNRDGNNSEQVVLDSSVSPGQNTANAVSNSSIANGADRSMVTEQSPTFAVQSDGSLQLVQGVDSNGYTTKDGVPVMVANTGNFVSLVNNHVLIPGQQFDLAPISNQQRIIRNEYVDNQPAFTNISNVQDGSTMIPSNVGPYINSAYNQQVPNSQVIGQTNLSTQQSIPQATYVSQVTSPMPPYIHHQARPIDSVFAAPNRSRNIVSTTNPSQHLSPVAVNYVPLQSNVMSQSTVISVPGYYRINDDQRYVISNSSNVNMFNNNNNHGQN